MCGIFCVLQYDGENKPSVNNTTQLLKCLDELTPRGPDKKANATVGINGCEIFMGFTRLSIMDTSDAGLQPFSNDNSFVLCNGEIYNYKELAENHQIKMSSGCDCEVLLPLYSKVGFEEMVKNQLDAEFAMVVVDSNKCKIYASRDRYGVRPLFYGYNTKTKIVGFASEMKALHPIMEYIAPFPPNKIASINISADVSNVINFTEYFDYNSLTPKVYLDDIDLIHNEIERLLTRAVEKRLHADRPVGFLLSGGLDSSLVVAIATKILGPDKIICFSVGLENSPDVVAAKKVVEYLGIKNHHIVPFSVEAVLKEVPNVIKIIESYDITTIRASSNQIFLAKFIGEMTNIKVILSGEGSDEEHGSYRYFRNAPSSKDFNEETLILLQELYMFDCLRTDRTMSGKGLEVRVPFLDFEFVKFIKRINPDLLMYKINWIEKQLIRDSFKGYLPDEILYRSKEALSDGVNTKETNWFRLLQQKLETEITDENLLNSKYIFNKPRTKEALYYRRIFDEFYPNRDNVIEHYWLPKWNGDIIDPSATVLKCY